MPVRKDQIDEVLAVIHKYVPAVKVPDLFAELKTVKAYSSNSSYRETIDRMAHHTTYTVEVKAHDKKTGACRGNIFENGILIGTFKRPPRQEHYCPPIEAKFRSDGAMNRFCGFADSISIGEAIEAMAGVA